MVKLYLDENVNILLASLLQPRKISVITTLESRMLGKNDREQLDFATGLDAAIVTHNRADFEHLFREYFSTTIRYAQPTRSLVNLEVLNLLAQQVQELVNSEQEAGHPKPSGRRKVDSPRTSTSIASTRKVTRRQGRCFFFADLTQI